MKETENKNIATLALIIVPIVVASIGCFGLIASAAINKFPAPTFPSPALTSAHIFPTETLVIQTPTLETIIESNKVSTNTITPTIRPTQVIFSPLPSDYISIKGFIGIVNSGGVSGDIKYSHLVSGKIKYERVEADDDITKVELVCEGNQIQDITSSFFLIAQPAGSIFPNYASNEINVPINCRIDFSVKDILGGQTGITIRSVSLP